MTKAGLPIEGLLDMRFEKDVLMLLRNKLCKQLEVDIFIHLPLKDTKAKLKVRLTYVEAPGDSVTYADTTLSHTDYEDIAKATGFMRADHVMGNELRKKMWWLYGTTYGPNERPICISILPDVISSYSFKREDEELQNFNPLWN